MTKGTRWLIAGLAVSLALNFLIIGFIAGHPGRGFSLTHMAEDLSPESQQILNETMREQRRELRPIFRERRQARREAGRILKADEFDAGALKAAFTRMRNADLALQALIQNTLADVAAQLPPEERAKMADWRKRMMERGGNHGPRGPHGPKGPERPYSPEPPANDVPE